MRLSSLTLAAVLTLTTACGGGTASVDEDKTRVVASLYPLAWLTERVGGADVAIVNLTKPGAEPHDLELSPKEIATVSEADLVLYLKKLQPAVDDAVAQHAADSSLELSGAVSPLEPAEHEEDGHGDEDGDQHGDEHGETIDPHLWLDPSRMAAAAKATASRLAEIDPAHAAGYRQRAESLGEKLAALHDDFKNGLSTCDSKTIVTGHAAFAYLADAYGLRQEPIAGLDPHNEPSPSRIAEVRRVVRGEGVRTIFTEAKLSDKAARTLARDAGVKTAVLNPLEAPPDSGDYLTAMRANLATLQSALGCDR